MANFKKTALCLSLSPLQASMSLRKITETKSLSLPKMTETPSNFTNSANTRPLPSIATKKQVFSLSKQPEAIKDHCNLYLDFSKFHNKNLSLIKKLSDKAEAQKLINTTSTRVDSPMQRFKKIKKFFHVKYANNGNNTGICCGNSNSGSGMIKVYKRKRMNDSTEANDLKSNEESEQYHYTISHQGNNSKIVAKCLKMRSQWEECPNDKQPHFLWTPISMNIDFSLFVKSRLNRRMTNHFEFHSQLTNKLNLFMNMMSYCESKAIDVFNYIPMTIMIQYDSQSYLKQFLSFSSIYNNITDYLSESADPKKKYREYFELDSKERIGHKASFYIKNTHFNSKNLWLVKAIDLNRGRCIKFGNTLEEIEKIIKLFYIGLLKNCSNNEKDSQSREEERKIYFFPNIKAKEFPSLRDFRTTKDTYRSGVVIVQKYIERPLLYKGRKFDLRLWVMLSHKMSIYVFKEGHLKASSIPFDIESSNMYIHLTNYSVQRKSIEFSKYEKGNEIAFEDFEYSLVNEHKAEVSFRMDLFPQLCHIVNLSLKSVRNKINAYERHHCFEIFGYDFMFDVNFKPFLIEVNTNPGLEISSPLIEELVPRMINDALKLTLDEVFHLHPQRNGGTNEDIHSFHVKGYEDNENMWLCVGNVLDD